SQIVVERGKGLILDVSSGWMGSIHDFRVFEGSRVVRKFARFKVKGWVDGGYEGIERVAIGWEIKKPKKKPKGGELTEEEKERNREINRERVEVEHKILAMKRYQFFGGKYRGRGKGYGETVELLAGLVNMEQMRRMGMAWVM
ncbi:MAG: transposase family protein, partial [Armatimonadota bacterium]